jgi:FMN phosphatase YigB (HAD superfamily)
MNNGYKYKIYALALSTLLGSCITAPLAIIFDVGDVLVETDSFKAFEQMGYKRVISYIMNHPTHLPSLTHTIRYNGLFGFFNTIQPRSATTPLLYDEQGVLMPQVMCDWLSGTFTGPVLLKALVQEMRNRPAYFASIAQKNLIRRLITMIFTPATIIATRKLIPDSVALVRWCKKEGHKLYILSNWDALSFEFLRKKYAELFDLFDGIVISGDLKLIKPQPAIYQHLLAKYQLEAAECVFIDDRPENIAIAAQLGIHAIQFKQTRAWWNPFYKQSNTAQIQQMITALTTPSLAVL